MNHLTDTSIKHDVKYVSASVPVDNAPIISVLILLPVTEPLNAHEAFELITNAVFDAGLAVRDCGIDDFTIAHGNLSLSLGT